MKQDFLNYIQETFSFSDQELWEFATSLSQPLKKTIRINTNKISIADFKKRAETNNWTLTPTSLGKNMFYIDRIDDLDIALWNTMEHLNGYFYVQELAASSSPYFMSWDEIDTWNYTILDMSASPGWKTTQLSEYYPNSLIIANELDKSRLKWLFSNIDRMWGENICVTNYDGRFFKQTPELFDKVLLDAPCSGEGTAFKTDDALKFWNLKNIKRIAKLQFWLLEAAGKALKVDWELVYSTCTLNTMENEEVLEKFLKKYDWYFEIIPLWENDFIRNWPHKNHTGWFFVAKLQKIQSLEWNQEIKHVRQNYEKLSSNDTKLITEFYKNIFAVDISDMYIYTYRWDIYLSKQTVHDLWEKLFFYQIGKKIGSFENGEFIPNFYGNTSKKAQIWTINLLKKDINTLYKGEELKTSEKDGYYEVYDDWFSGGIGKIKEGKLKSLLDTGKMRK